MTAPTTAVPSSLTRLRPLRWLGDFLLDWAVVVGTFVFLAHAWSYCLVPFAALLIGARLHALGLLAHDAAHRLAFPDKRLNDFAAEAIAWPLFLVIGDGYRPWHFAHHRTLGTEADPELGYRAHTPYAGRTTWGKIVRQFLLDMAGFGVVGLVRFLLAVFPYSRPWRMLGPLLLWTAFLGVCLWTGHLWIFGLWAWSILTGFWAVFRIRTWTEHVGVPPAGKETSHRFAASWLARFLFFPHNTHCHYEHHKWPQVPYYNLPALRERDRERPVVPLPALFPAPRGISVTGSLSQAD